MNGLTRYDDDRAKLRTQDACANLSCVKYVGAAVMLNGMIIRKRDYRKSERDGIINTFLRLPRHCHSLLD